MSNSKFSTASLLGAALLVSGSAPTHAIGQTTTGNNGSEWVYGFAPAAIPQGSACLLDTTFNATPVTTALAGTPGRGLAMGVPAIDMAAGDYGWFQRRGPVSVRVAANAAAKTRMNTTAVAGVLGTDATAGSIQVGGITLVTAQGASAGVAAAQGASFFETAQAN